MTNVFRQSSEEPMQPTSSARPLIMRGMLCIALCAFYIVSIRIMEAQEYALRNAANAHDNAAKQHEELGRQLDSLRSLSVISQAPALGGFEETRKPLYLNMDSEARVAAMNTLY